MDGAVKRVDSIIARKGECIIGGIMEKVLGFDRETMANELRARGYVVINATSVRDGYVVYPRHRSVSCPHLIAQVI